MSFTNDTVQTQATTTDQVQPSAIRTVFVSQVITEPELINKSTQLEQALEYGNFTGKSIN